MQHLRLIVVDLTNAVAAILANHAEMLTMRDRLNCVPNVAQGSARFDFTNTGTHGFISGVDQAFGQRAGLTNKIHAAAIAKPAVFNNGNVDVHDIALL